MWNPIDPLKLPRFAGPVTYSRLPQTHDADVLILGIPYDGGTTFRPGTRFGPRKIREASVLNRSFNPANNQTPFKKINVADGGDMEIIPISIERTYEVIDQSVAQLYQSGKRGLFLGGDHSITLPIFRGISKAKGKNSFKVVHFDAHSDTGDQAWGCPYHHGTSFRRAIEEGLIKGTDVLQIGIRGPLTDATNLDFAKAAGITIVTFDECMDLGIKAVSQKIQSFVGNSSVYVSLDIDSADPSIAPGTGTPVVGGFTAHDLQRMVRSLQGKNILGSDVVEVSPPYDVADLTSLLAANLSFELLCCY